MCNPISILLFLVQPHNSLRQVSIGGVHNGMRQAAFRQGGDILRAQGHLQRPHFARPAKAHATHADLGKHGHLHREHAARHENVTN